MALCHEVNQPILIQTVINHSKFHAVACSRVSYVVWVMIAQLKRELRLNWKAILRKWQYVCELLVKLFILPCQVVAVWRFKAKYGFASHSGIITVIIQISHYRERQRRRYDIHNAFLTSFRYILIYLYITNCAPRLYPYGGGKRWW